MRDLYKRLDVAPDAADHEIRAALASAEPATREAAEFVLLDPDRRAVYDRNRRVLSTVGELRGRLGLNLTAFWPKPRFGDFAVDLTPPPGGRRGLFRPREQRPHRPLDSKTVLWAFGKPPVDAKSAARQRWQRRALWSVGVLLGIAAAVWAWVTWG